MDQALADEQLAGLPPGQGEGLGEALAGRTATARDNALHPTSPGEVVWPLGDHLGSVRDLAVYDAQTDMTAVVNHRVFDSFGNVRSATDPASNQAATADCLFAFTGRPLDSYTSLQNNLNRWYDPSTARWLNQDPLGFPAADPNLSRYCGNNPANEIDPTGLDRPTRHWPHRGPGGCMVLPSPALSADEQRLIDMCNGDPELLGKVQILLDVLHKTRVWPIWFNRCHAWDDKFEELYNQLDPKDRFAIERHYPFCDVWYAPLWLNHSVITFTLAGKTIYLDKAFQGGSDHIAFEPHPDLIYMGDPRWQLWFDYYVGQKPAPPPRPLGAPGWQWHGGYGRGGWQ